MILIIDQNPKNSRGLSDMFSYMGILSYVTSAENALYEPLSLFSAILFSDADKIQESSLILRIRNAFLGIPVFAISSHFQNESLFDLTFKKGIYASAIYSQILTYSQKRKIRAPGVYKTEEIDASAMLSHPIYMGEQIKLTRTENFILKALILSSPKPIFAKELLKYVFKPTKTPDISNIRTHISIINKKFREKTGQNLISHSNLGYCFCSEQADKKKELQTI